MSQNLPITWALSSVGIWAECKEQIKRTSALSLPQTHSDSPHCFPSLTLFSPRKKMLMDVDIKTTSLKEIWRKGIGLYNIAPWICTTLPNYCLRKIPAQLICYCADQSRNWEELRLERGLRGQESLHWKWRKEKVQGDRIEEGHQERVCVCVCVCVWWRYRGWGRIVSWLWGEWRGPKWGNGEWRKEMWLSVENTL